MTGTAIDRVNPNTGETTAVVEFNMSDYLASVSTPAAIEHQKRLAAAYDKACDSLIGANDVQQEGQRSFKKKSAWRKLARHFNISTDVLRVDREYLNEHFLATVTVRARAPWGQSAEAVGACCTDEATGRRVITIADAIATAETRATNRAVSNLIAMGEVSAEEIGDRPAQSSGAPRQASNTRGGPVTTMPFGKHKGKSLVDLPDDELRSTADWCRSKDKFPDLAAACDAIIEGRNGAPLGLDGRHDESEEIPF